MNAVERIMVLADAYRAAVPETTDPHDLTAVDVARDELRAAIERLEAIPFAEYYEAQKAGCDSNGAWDLFVEACGER